MKKVLVTGATGFIGKYVIKTLQQKNVYIIATSRTIDASLYNTDPNTITIPFDLKNTSPNQDLFTYFQKPDLLIHLAWEGLPHYKEAFHIEENLPRHYEFLSNLIKNGLKDITITGTCFEYGMQDGCLTESMISQPANIYAKAKDQLRKSLEKSQNEIPFSLKWLRLFYMYGEGQNKKSLIPQLKDALAEGAPVFNMSGGAQTRDFLHAQEVADYIVKAALQDKIDGIINISSNRPISVKQFVLDYLSQKNKQIHLNLGFYPYPDFEPMHFWGDNSKLKSIK